MIPGVLQCVFLEITIPGFWILIQQFLGHRLGCKINLAQKSDGAAGRSVSVSYWVKALIKLIFHYFGASGELLLRPLQNSWTLRGGAVFDIFMLKTYFLLVPAGKSNMFSGVRVFVSNFFYGAPSSPFTIQISSFVIKYVLLLPLRCHGTWHHVGRQVHNRKWFWGASAW